jgi:predicted DNA-binding transcriptional regulator AlpA
MDIVGLHEAAAMLGWDKRKLSTYIKRGKFPAPVVRLKATPIWERWQIEEYKERREEKNG